MKELEPKERCNKDDVNRIEDKKDPWKGSQRTVSLTMFFTMFSPRKGWLLWEFDSWSSSFLLGTLSTEERTILEGRIWSLLWNWLTCVDEHYFAIFLLLSTLLFFLPYLCSSCNSSSTFHTYVLIFTTIVFLSCFSYWLSHNSHTITLPCLIYSVCVQPWGGDKRSFGMSERRMWSSKKKKWSPSNKPVVWLR